MPRIEPPAKATVLWRWMYSRRVSVETLAERLGISVVYLSQLRRRARRPSDALKVKIAEVTMELEKKDGVRTPKGVPVGAWFEKEDDSAVG